MNFRNTQIFTLLPILLYASSCYVTKPLDHDVRVSFNNDFPIVMKNEGSSTFSTKHTEAEYRKAYTDELTKELNLNHIIVDNASPEFMVQISELEITESTKPDTVKDVKSKDNGMIRQLTLAGIKTHGTTMKAGSSSTKTWQADKDKNESLTNNRSLDQMIAGENKDGSTYREKAFDDNEFVRQAGICGRRAAVRITHDIQSFLKK